jgi:translation initiation factor IF-2
MSVRVYELAKELGLSSQDVRAMLGAMGVVAKSHSSTVEDEVAVKLKEKIQKGDVKEAPPPPRPARPKRPTRSAAAPAKRPSAERQAPPPAERQALAAAAARAKAPAAQPAPAAQAKPEAPAAQPKAEAPAVTEEALAKTLSVHRGITVQDLAAKLGVAPAEVVKKLFLLGEMATATQSLSDEAVELVGSDYGLQIQVVSPEDEEEEIVLEDDAPEDLTPRPPVITIMGHVDHGKTKLLDYIRSADVVAGEFGGITQHIGAYQSHKNDREITFIDTPGHEAFTQMRARGAKVTDIAVLVVAADDGVKPQTIEAISHAKAAGVPIVVAVNKVDKPEADPMKVRQQVAEQGLNPEEWGGDTIFVDVSAKTGANVDQLLDMLLLVADIQELKANAKAAARGVAIEAHLDKGRGPVATVLVQRGTLRVGDAIVCGGAWARVRAMLDENGQPEKDAGPGQPVQVLGFSTVPQAGDTFMTVEDERAARHIAQDRLAKQRAAELISQKRVTLDELFAQIGEGEISELNVVLKADVQGSLEAIEDALNKIIVGDVKVRILHKAAGQISENDITLAQASGAVVIGFNVRPSPAAAALAEKETVDIRTYQIIYKLVEDVEAALKGLLKPEFEERVLGRAVVRQTFKVPKIGLIAGSYVEDGTITRGSKVRLLREGVVLADSVISSLKRFKDDAREVQQGFECGIGIDNFQDIKDGDVMEAYEVREIPRV